MLKPKASTPACPDTRALDRFVGYRLKRAWHVVEQDLQRTLKPFGLSKASFSALAVIQDNPGLRQSQLAQALAIKGPNMVAIIDDLERKDLVQRSTPPWDRRTHALNATPTGQTLSIQAAAAVLAHEHRIYGQFLGDELATLRRTLGEIGGVNSEQTQ